MRIEDYQFYGRLCLGFGALLSIIGIILLASTTRIYYYAGPYIYSPYSGGGVALIVAGVSLIVSGAILFREYRFRTTTVQGISPPPPPAGYCPHCGTAREEDSVYCKKCGKKLP